MLSCCQKTNYLYIPKQTALHSHVYVLASTRTDREEDQTGGNVHQHVRPDFKNISWALGQNTHPPNSDLKVPFCTNIHWAFGGERYKSGNIFISDQSNPGPKAWNQLHPKLNFWWRFFDTLKIKKTRKICVKSW